MKNKRFVNLLILEVAVVCIVAIFFFVDTSDMYRFFVGDTTFVEQDSSCDLHVSSCSVVLESNNTMSFDIEPKSIPLMEPLKLTAILEKPIDETTLDLAIYATNMNMGYHTFTMKKVAPKTYEATGILPTCTVGDMIWRAEVSIDKPTKSYGGAFTFQTE